MINLTTYKRKPKNTWKKRKWNLLVKSLGYNFNKRRFKYYNWHLKYFFKDIRKRKKWKTRRMIFIYSIILNKLKHRRLNLWWKRVIFRRYKKLDLFNKIKIYKLINILFELIIKLDLLSIKEVRAILKKKEIKITNSKELYKNEIIDRLTKYLKKNTAIQSMRRAKRYGYSLRWRRKFKKNYYKKNIFNLVLKQSNNNFFITINDSNNNTLWHRSAGQFFGSDKHNIKIKRSHLLVNDMLPFLKNKLREYKIKCLKIYLKSNITRHMYKVIDYLTKQNIIFYYIKFIKPMPHHKGDRKKKLKRR